MVEAPFLRKFFSFPNLPLQSVALFPYSYSILLLLLSHLIFDLSAPRFVLCYVSLALLPIFTQNLMFIRCSRFLSLIFPSTVYHGNERFIWSVAHVNASWNMSNRAWVHEFAWLNTPAIRCDYSGNLIAAPRTKHFEKLCVKWPSLGVDLYIRGN
jgi:hypothetical protein